MRKWTAAILLVSLGIWAGTMFFFNSVAALRIFGYFERLPSAPTPGLGPVSPDVSSRMAGDLIATIFPAYFAIQGICGVIATGAAIVLAREGTTVDRARAAFVAAVCVLTLAHAATLYRQASQIRVERYAAVDAGDAARAEELRKAFFRLHGPSLALDIGACALAIFALASTGASIAASSAPSPTTKGAG